jgi:uncharacterized protein YerC
VQGIAIVTSFEPEERGQCVVADAVAGGAACASSAVQAPDELAHNYDTLLYFFLRRWLTSRKQEAVAAFLEDCLTLHELSTAHSRLKWARAIVASVESEKHCADIFGAMTGVASRGVQDAHDIAAAWSHVVSQVSAATNGSQLPTRAFDIPYAYVVRHVTATYMPAFLCSRECSIYNNVVAAVQRAVRESETLRVCSTSIEDLLRQASSKQLTSDDFEQGGCVGAGSYGSVSVWRHTLTGTVYAVKAMDKRTLHWKASVHTVIRELACSLAVHSNYVASFDFVFSDANTVYAGMRLYFKGKSAELEQGTSCGRRTRPQNPFRRS